MIYDAEKHAVKITSGELSEYAFRYSTPDSIVRKFGLEKIYVREDPVFTEKEIPESLFTYDDAKIIISVGKLRLYDEDNALLFMKNAGRYMDARFLSECVISSYFFCLNSSAESVKTIIKVPGNGGVPEYYSKVITVTEGLNVLNLLISRAFPLINYWREFSENAPVVIENMKFPYKNVRKGQLEFVQTTYKAIKNGSNLLINAPTGIGKTIAAIYPSLKAVGKGHISRIYYLTSKNTNSFAVIDAVNRLGLTSGYIKTIIIRSFSFFIRKGSNRRSWSFCFFYLFFCYFCFN